MGKTSNLAAYIAWALALVAILMPPTFATAGIEAVSDASEAVFSLVEDQPESLALAAIRAEEPGWQA